MTDVAPTIGATLVEIALLDPKRVEKGMGIVFILYVGFTLYLYFAREPIRLEVNFVLGRWYEIITEFIYRMRQSASSAYRQRRNRRY